MVPVGHGRWLAQHLPSVELNIGAGDGHLSIVTTAVPQLLDQFAGLADLPH
jgi:hypothetical protein